LQLVGFIHHAHMEVDFAGWRAGIHLQFDADPAVTFAGLLVAFGRHRGGIAKISGIARAALHQALDQQAVFVIHHLAQTLDAHIALCFAVDDIADLHIVGRRCFGNRPRCRPGAEKLPRHFLPRANLDNGAVLLFVEVDIEGFLFGGQFGWLVVH